MSTSTFSYASKVKCNQAKGRCKNDPSKESRVKPGSISTNSTNSTNSTTNPTPTSKSLKHEMVLGLDNLHNTCYFNSVIQCLIQIDPLTNYLLQHSKDISAAPAHVHVTAESSVKQKEENLAFTYIAFLQSITNHNNDDTNTDTITVTNNNHGNKQNNKNKVTSISPWKLLQSVKHTLAMFDNFHQHDPHEFCSFFIQALHEQLNRQKKSKTNSFNNNNNTTNNEDTTTTTTTTNNNNNNNTSSLQMSIQYWKQYLHQNDSIIVDHMQGLLQNYIHCPQCSYSSVSFDMYTILSLPIPSSSSSISIQDCLATFNQSHTLDDSNTWFCTNCKQCVNAKKGTRIWTLPNIFIIHLQRFDSGLMKNHAHVPILDTLNLESFVHGPTKKDTTTTTTNNNNNNNENDAHLYKLIGVCHHEGKSVHSGHYTANVRNYKNDQWYHCNDGLVEEGNNTISNSRNSKGGDKRSTPYLLFYQHVGGSGGNDKNNSNIEPIIWSGLDQYIKSRHHNIKQVDEDGFTVIASKKKHYRKR